MGALQSYVNDTTNPLDLIERLAERRDWSVDRTNDCEVTMVMGGRLERSLRLAQLARRPGIAAGGLHL